MAQFNIYVLYFSPLQWKIGYYYQNHNVMVNTKLNTQRVNSNCATKGSDIAGLAIILGWFHNTLSVGWEIFYYFAFVHNIIRYCLAHLIKLGNIQPCDTARWILTGEQDLHPCTQTLYSALIWNGQSIIDSFINMISARGISSMKYWDTSSRRKRYMRVGWKVHRLTVMQHFFWVEFDQMWFLFQHSLPCGPHTSSIGVGALGFLWCRSSHSDFPKGPKLQIWSRHRLKLLPSQVFLSCWGTENRWYQIRRLWRVINQFKATVTHSSHCKHRLVCRSIVLVKQDSLHQFARTFMKCSSTYYFSKSWITYPVYVFLTETLQLISGTVEFNACQVTLLWHYFLINLWTFQPTLVRKVKCQQCYWKVIPMTYFPRRNTREGFLKVKRSHLLMCLETNLMPIKVISCVWKQIKGIV